MTTLGDKEALGEPTVGSSVDKIVVGDADEINDIDGYIDR